MQFNVKIIIINDNISIHNLRTHANILKKRLVTYTPNILSEENTGFSEDRNCTGPVFTLEQITAKLEEFVISTFVYL
jgi:hypothetical protein